jgi:hypothetical protein
MADDEHFELLCKMTDELYDYIVEDDNRRNLCERCEYVVLKYKNSIKS